jgi:hypothetical protein
MSPSAGPGAPGSRGGRRRRGWSSSAGWRRGRPGRARGPACGAGERRSPRRWPRRAPSRGWRARGAAAPAGLGLELGEQAVDVVDVLGALDLRDHDDVELVADLGDEGREVVEHPRRVEAVDPRPELGVAEVGALATFTRPARAFSLFGRPGSRPRGCRAGRRPWGDVGQLRHHLLVAGSKKWIIRTGGTGSPGRARGPRRRAGLKKSLAAACSPSAPPCVRSLPPTTRGRPRLPSCARNGSTSSAPRRTSTRAGGRAARSTSSPPTGDPPSNPERMPRSPVPVGSPPRRPRRRAGAPGTGEGGRSPGAAPGEVPRVPCVTSIPLARGNDNARLRRTPGPAERVRPARREAGSGP